MYFAVSYQRIFGCQSIKEHFVSVSKSTTNQQRYHPCRIAIHFRCFCMEEKKKRYTRTRHTLLNMHKFSSSFTKLSTSLLNVIRRRLTNMQQQNSYIQSTPMIIMKRQYYRFLYLICTKFFFFTSFSSLPNSYDDDGVC